MGGVLLRIFGAALMLTALTLPLLRAPDRDVQSLVARWAPPPSDFLDLRGQLVHYRDEGPRNDPLPIVLLHGTSSSLHTWEGWAKALRGRRRVISFDLPGFGLTGPWAGAYAGALYDGEHYARFTLDVLAELKVARFAIGGNSLGGEVAWRVAALVPQRVDRLLLVDAAGYAFAPSTVPLGWRLATLPGADRVLPHLLPRPLVTSGLVDVYGDPGRIDDALVDRYFELSLRTGNRLALIERLRQPWRASDEAMIATLKLPTLILWGGRDRVIPPEIGRRFERDIVGSRLIIFEPLGHVPQEEDAAVTAAVAKAFLGPAR